VSLADGRARYEAWLALWPRPRIEVVPGLLAGRLPYGGLDDPDVREGDPIRGGGYGEARGAYLSDLFRPQDGSEPRTVHLGFDVFAPAGTPVRAPLEGRIHSFADNAQPGDYGPTLILEHRPQPPLVFWTLYGHLSRDSLTGLRADDAVAEGQRIAALGARAENGGWAPHLHLQVILDINASGVRWRGDFPGVCRASERERWLAICPDPAELVGLQTQ
jgi:murein DD-endopeptidase MepM/ murein hydrolase activator NlpD